MHVHLIRACVCSCKVLNSITLHLNTAPLCECVITTTMKHAKHDATPKDATEGVGLGELGKDVALQSDDG